MERRHRHLDDGAVDQAHQPQLLGDGDQMSGGDDLARRIGHAQQGLVKNRNPGRGIDHRLEGQAETLFPQAADDLGGAVGIEGALGKALRRGLVDDIAVGGEFPRLGQRLFGARHRGVGVGGMFRQDQRADRQQRPDRPALGLDHAFARHAQEALGGNAQVLFDAAIENQPELRARIAGDGVAGAHHLAEPAAHVDDHFVGDLEAIGVVHHRQIVDGGDDEGAMGAVPRRHRHGAP